MADSSIKLGVQHIRATAIAGTLMAATMSSSAIAGESAYDLASKLRADSVNRAARTANTSHSSQSRRTGFDRRALAYQPTTAEPGWFVERADNSSLRISVLSQTRYTYSQRDPGFIPGGTEQTTGFSLPRTRVAFDGAIVSSQFQLPFVV